MWTQLLQAALGNALGGMMENTGSFNNYDAASFWAGGPPQGQPQQAQQQQQPSQPQQAAPQAPPAPPELTGVAADGGLGFLPALPTSYATGIQQQQAMQQPPTGHAGIANVIPGVGPLIANLLSASSVPTSNEQLAQAQQQGAQDLMSDPYGLPAPIDYGSGMPGMSSAPVPTPGMPQSQTLGTNIPQAIPVQEQFGWGDLFKLNQAPGEPNVLLKLAEGYNRGGVLGALGLALTDMPNPTGSGPNPYATY